MRRKIYLLTLLFIVTVMQAYSQVTWTGNGGDGLWNTASNWSGNAVPATTDNVLLDNSVVTGTYTVTLPTGAVTVTINRLTITPTGTNNITLILPSGNTGNPGFKVGDNTSSTDDIILNSGAILKNSSGGTAGNGIEANSTTNGTLRINNGGRYVHNTGRSTGGVNGTFSTVTGTETGIFEYDSPGTGSTAITASGKSYGTLMLTRTAGAATYTSSGGSALTVRGDLVINTGVTYTSSMTGALNLAGNLTNNGAALTIPAGQATVFNGNGSSAKTTQTISGSGAVTFNESATVNASAVVKLGIDIAIASGKTFTVNGILDASTHVISGAGNFTLTTVSNATLKTALAIGIDGNLAVTGAITLNSGNNYEFDGSAASAVTGSLLPSTVGTISFNNSNGVTLSNPILVNGTLYLSSGTLNTGTSNITIGGAGYGWFSPGTVLNINNAAATVNFNGRQVEMWSSSATNMAAIAPIAGALTNASFVYATQYLTPQRAYRLMGHPFTGNIAISSFDDSIAVTGSGSNLMAGNASAYNYLTGVWSPYTDATQTWNKNEALFLFVRGEGGQGIGITNGSYTPNPAYMRLVGTLNTGNLNYTVKTISSFSSGSATGWNAIGNPYPAPIDVNSIGNITGPGAASVYVWNATKGSTSAGLASGGYDFYTLGGSSIIIPVYGAFFIKNTSGTDQVINFTENNKVVGTANPPYSLLGASTTPVQSFLLTIADSITYWDKLKISFDNKSTTASTDRTDLEKFSNINLDFYSLASDNKQLAINSLPALQSETDVIALGLKTSQQRTFTVKASEVSLPTGNNLYLHDKYTNNWTKIAEGMSYNFSVTADSASQGNNRFEVAMKAPENPSIIPVMPASLTVQAGPNPAKDHITISFASPKVMQTNIRIVDMSGKTVSNINAGKVQSGVQQVTTNTWSKGLYLVQVNNGKEVVTKEIVKE